MSILPSYTSVELSKSVRTLQAHVNNKELFTKASLGTAIGMTVSEDFSGKNRRRSMYQDCKLINTNFTNAGCLGSTYRNTDFIDCDFSSGSFHSCKFENVKIVATDSHKEQIVGAGFHRSVFLFTLFKNITFISCGFTDVLFYNCEFDHCRMTLCSLENAEFRNCKLSHTTFQKINLEYASFNDSAMDHVILPFASLPYLFSGLQDILKSGSKVSIYSKDSSNGTISTEEYMKLMPDFITFFSASKEFFPLANVLFAQKKFDFAYDAVITGILDCVRLKDFRMLQHFCKIVYMNDVFTSDQRKNLLDNIEKWTNVKELTEGDLHEYNLHIGSIRQMLIYNNYAKHTLRFSINTLLTSFESVSILLELISELIPKDDSTTYYIELRHNSPFDIDLTLVSTELYSIFKFLAVGYAALKGSSYFIDLITKMITNIQDVTLKRSERKKNEVELSLADLNRQEKELNIKKQALEIEKLKSEIEDMKERAHTQKHELVQRDIAITRVEHLLSNTPYIVDNRFLSYKL